MTNVFRSCAGICGFQGELFSRVHAGNFATVLRGQKRKTQTINP